MDDDELRALAEAVPAGDWGGGALFGDGSPYLLEVPGEGDIWLHDVRVAEFVVAASPAAVLALLDRIRELESAGTRPRPEARE
ncbi:hypothetical protein J2Y69_002297 [Microbacterium resistens]|uniref:Uncharacterized protein n=1 Tax=Microbacterium resistens TaxID=156977 RepID=A0ABU1SEK6_9MICO|nr:hypothetical protein [Microbacterium resistens]